MRLRRSFCQGTGEWSLIGNWREDDGVVRGGSPIGWEGWDHPIGCGQAADLAGLDDDGVAIAAEGMDAVAEPCIENISV